MFAAFCYYIYGGLIALERIPELPQLGRQKILTKPQYIDALDERNHRG